MANPMFSMVETLTPNCTRRIPSTLSSSRQTFTSNLQSPSSLACKSAFCHLKFRFATQLRFEARKWEILAATMPASVVDDESMSIDNLRRFIDLNAGKWSGSFYVSRLMVLLSSYFQTFSVVLLWDFGLTNAAIRCSWKPTANCEYKAFSELLWGGWADQPHSNVRSLEAKLLSSY